MISAFRKKIPLPFSLSFAHSQHTHTHTHSHTHTTLHTHTHFTHTYIHSLTHTHTHAHFTHTHFAHTHFTHTISYKNAYHSQQLPPPPPHTHTYFHHKTNSAHVQDNCCYMYFSPHLNHQALVLPEQFLTLNAIHIHEVLWHIPSTPPPLPLPSPPSLKSPPRHKLTSEPSKGQIKNANRQRGGKLLKQYMCRPVIHWLNIITLWLNHEWTTKKKKKKKNHTSSTQHIVWDHCQYNNSSASTTLKHTLTH